LTDGLGLTLRGDVSFRSEQFLSQNLDLPSRQSGYAVSNLRLAIERRDGRREVAAFVTNLFDVKYATQVYGTPPVEDGTETAFIGDRRRWGMSLRSRF
jgi:outer membrane receptor protein involved in Fe transport